MGNELAILVQTDIKDGQRASFHGQDPQPYAVRFSLDKPRDYIHAELTPGMTFMKCPKGKRRDCRLITPLIIPCSDSGRLNP